MDESVATTLREARTAKGLELGDIAEITHVRKEYLKALEEGRYSDLPEDIYSRNFLRLYAQALGLEDSKLLDHYGRERRSALGITPNEPIRNQNQEIIHDQESSASKPFGWILTLLLLAALAGLGYFAYSRNLLASLFNPTASEISNTAPTLPSPDVSEIINDESSENLATTDTELGTTELIEDAPILEEPSSDEAVLETTLDAEATLLEAEETQPSGNSPETISEPSSDTSSETITDEPIVPDALATTEDISEENTTEENIVEENTVENNPTETPEASTTQETNPAVTTETSDVRFTLITDPPGADASIDNYSFASRTPVFNAPVSAREARVLRIELEGYETYEELLDVVEDTSLSISLKPIGAQEATSLSPATPLSPATTATETTTLQPSAQGKINVSIEVETWLEVYQSTKRGEGEQLYYGTAQTGEALSYNLPVYIHVGNAAGIRINENGRDVGLMGSSGEVTGRSFGQPLPVQEVVTEPTDETTSDENVTDEPPTDTPPNE